MTAAPPVRCGCPENEGLTRRRFLQAFGTAGAAVAAAPLLASQAAYAADASYSGPILLVLSLRGGMDGLSAVAPVGDPDYLRRRPNIAVPTRTAVPVGSQLFGLHPALAPLKPMWDAGQMSAVHAVGTPDGSRSHFTAMEELERAAPGTSVRTGWLNRVLGAVGTGTIYEGVHLGAGNAPRLLAGPATALATRSLASFSLSGHEWVGPRMTTAIRALHAGSTLPAVAPALLTLAALDSVADVVSTDAGAQNGAVYPVKSQLGAALADAAVLVRAGGGLQALTIDIGDWDMHDGLGNRGEGWMADKLADLAAGITAFAQDLGPLWGRVTVITMSEFGRRVAENGSGGVDHGHANAVLLMGGGLVGRTVHGRWPGLTDGALDHGDLAGTTDYRNVLAEFMVRRMALPQAQLASVFPGLTTAFPGAFVAA